MSFSIVIIEGSMHSEFVVDALPRKGDWLNIDGGEVTVVTMVFFNLSRQPAKIYVHVKERL